MVYLDMEGDTTVTRTISTAQATAAATRASTVTETSTIVTTAPQVTSAYASTNTASGQYRVYDTTIYWFVAPVSKFPCTNKMLQDILVLLLHKGGAGHYNHHEANHDDCHKTDQFYVSSDGIDCGGSLVLLHVTRSPYSD